MTDTTEPKTAGQPLRVIQLNALIEELTGLYARTKDDEALERRRSILLAHAYAVRDTLVELANLAEL